MPVMVMPGIAYGEPKRVCGIYMAENARFSPLAKMLRVASCDLLAKKGKMGS